MHILTKFSVIFRTLDKVQEKHSIKVKILEYLIKYLHLYEIIINCASVKGCTFFISEFSIQLYRVTSMKSQVKYREKL